MVDAAQGEAIWSCYRQIDEWYKEKKKYQAAYADLAIHEQGPNRFDASRCVGGDGMLSAWYATETTNLEMSPSRALPRQGP